MKTNQELRIQLSMIQSRDSVLWNVLESLGVLHSQAQSRIHETQKHSNTSPQSFASPQTTQTRNVSSPVDNQSQKRIPF